MNHMVAKPPACQHGLTAISLTNDCISGVDILWFGLVRSAARRKEPLMQLNFAHFRNRFCMFRTYYALANRLIKPDGFDLNVLETADPPSAEQIELLVSGAVDAADLYLPSFLAQRIKGARILGIATEWKTTSRGNGIFVRADSPITTAKQLAGSTIGTHQGPHVVHRYLLKHLYDVDESALRWATHPQEELIDAIKSGRVDAAVLIDQVFFVAERDRGLRCLYTDGEGWQALTGYSEMVKHIIAVREPLLKADPGLRAKLLAAFKASLDYGTGHLGEIADAFIERYGGEKEALFASVKYPKIDFTFTEREQNIAQAEMEMLFEMGDLPRRIAVAPQFVV
jgi:ABC-type nitrate/sulfonate/bicarbonate transport system substrate-binding protein